jgi:hypothetical protein
LGFARAGDVTGAQEAEMVLTDKVAAQRTTLIHCRGKCTYKSETTRLLAFDTLYEISLITAEARQNISFETRNSIITFSKAKYV